MDGTRVHHRSVNPDSLLRALARLPSDAPLCVGFSGGLDSSAVVATIGDQTGVLMRAMAAAAAALRFSARNDV